MPAAAFAPTKRPISRINSMKRDWEEEEEQAVPWSQSPPRVGRKGALPTREPSPPPMQDPLETAADRRRKAILAAMSGDQNSAPPTKSASAPARPVAGSSTSSRSTTGSSTTAVGTSGSARAPLREVQELPSLTTALGGDKKRSMPWEGDQPNKKPVRTTSSKSNKSDASTGAMNIVQKISLSLEQQKVLTLVVQEGKNIFFTGSAGTGKSVLLREIIKNLRQKHVKAPDAVAVTASTGIAACNIGGVTLHSFGGAGLCLEPVDVLVSKIKKNKKAAARWLRTKVLIIDELSMVDGELFDKFCKIGQKMRKNEKPFGGIQVIVTGDFFQLPPVTKGGKSPKFCFDAATWKETISMEVNLTKVFRQKDQTFVNMLNEMRFGRMSQDTIARFKALNRPLKFDDDIQPTELFPRREDVERSNTFRLNALDAETQTYTASDTGAVTDPVQREKMLANFMALHQLELRVGAQVMLIKNVDEQLVNGSIGKVMGFVHKALFTTDLQGRWMPEGDLADLEEDEREKRERLREMLLARASSSMKVLPVVEFRVPGGTRHMLVEHDTFKNELPNGEVQVQRSQLPLILSWAMSIHKSQGQTLERVKVDLGKVFEKGQAYVALSRATSLDGLQVMGFSGDKVQAHPRVEIWSRNLRDLNTI